MLIEESGEQWTGYIRAANFNERASESGKPVNAAERRSVGNSRNARIGSGALVRLVN